MDGGAGSKSRNKRGKQKRTPQKTLLHSLKKSEKSKERDTASSAVFRLGGFSEENLNSFQHFNKLQKKEGKRNPKLFWNS